MTTPALPLSTVVKAMHALQTAMDSGQLSGAAWLQVMVAHIHLQTYLNPILADQPVQLTD